jgi:hypothetical protein
MFGSTVLDIAIGLVFVYLLLSLAVTAASELIASALKWRAQNLRKGLERLLNPALAQALYEHPLVSKLSKSGRGPSYLPSGTFALALLDVIANLNPGDPKTAGSLPAPIGNVPDPDVRRVLTLLAEEAGPDGQRLRDNIETWFNNSMDRVSGWYKRKTQIANVVLAVALTVAVNTDSVLIVNSLSNDSALRAALVAQAQKMAKGSTARPDTAPSTPSSTPMDELDKRIRALSALGIPVGWTDGSGDDPRRWPGWTPGTGTSAEWGRMWMNAVRSHLLGWLLTALAASLGAPFWFDVLNKIITIRSAGKTPDEAGKSRSGAPAS